MPVLKVYFSRLEKMTGLPRGRLLDRLPFLGLDIESVEEDSLRIEYNPNRLDFSTDYGIARALRGLVGKEVGLPRYRVGSGRMTVTVDRNLEGIRPYISCASARDLRLDDESIRQLISMQEDLHNGIGRKRRKVAIGLHNLDAISGPIAYKGVERTFAFVPLGSDRRMSLTEILEATEQGREYGPILARARLCPMLYDSEGTVLSFPPVINGDKTRVSTRTNNLFVDITSTEERLGEDALSVVCSALSDMGAIVESTRVKYSDRTKVTPDLSPSRMKFDGALAAALTGLDLTSAQMRRCLRRSRLDLDHKRYALIPRYRTDIIHPVDLSEEVAVGYGLDRISPAYPPSESPGSLHGSNVAAGRASESLACAGFAETMNFDLIDEEALYSKFRRSSDGPLEVENPRTLEHRLLRDSLIPSLMMVLARNVKAAYPQRIFEVGTVYRRDGRAVAESRHMAALIAHSSSSYSEVKMQLEALVAAHAAGSLETRAVEHWAFSKGRCAEAVLGGISLGHLGEVIPSAVAAFGLDVPVGGFEIDLNVLA